MRKSKKEIMLRAWDLCEEGQGKFGGKLTDYLSAAMKIAWAEARQPEEAHGFEQWANMITREFGSGRLAVRCSIWLKYGKCRIYVSRPNEELGYVIFNRDGKFIKTVATNSYRNEAMNVFNGLQERFA